MSERGGRAPASVNREAITRRGKNVMRYYAATAVPFNKVTRERRRERRLPSPAAETNPNFVHSRVPMARDCLLPRSLRCSLVQQIDARQTSSIRLQAG